METNAERAEFMVVHVRGDIDALQEYVKGLVKELDTARQLNEELRKGEAVASETLQRWTHLYTKLWNAVVGDNVPLLTDEQVVEWAVKHREAYNATYSTPPVEPLPFDFAFCASHYAFWKRDTLAAISRLVERLP